MSGTGKPFPFPRNWYESAKNMNVISVMTTENWYESCKDMSWIVKSKSGVEEEVRAKGKSDKHKYLLIKGSGALLLAPASDDNCCNMAKDRLKKIKSWAEEEIKTKRLNGENLDFLIKAVGALLLAPASDDNCCNMAKDKVERIKSWAEGEIKTKGINDEDLDFLIKAGGVLLLAPAIGYGIGSACVFMLKCAASDEDCFEMAKYRFEKKTNSWVEMAKNRFEKSKSWADEHRDLLVIGGGALLAAAAAAGYWLFKGGSSNDDDSSDDDEKLMKAPGRPGEYIARAAFEANPKGYFRRLRGKHP